MDEANWGGDDDSLGSLDEEIDAPGATASGEPGAGGTEAGGEVEEPEIFVPPSPGADPYQTLLRQNPTNVALNAVVGDF